METQENTSMSFDDTVSDNNNGFDEVLLEDKPKKRKPIFGLLSIIIGAASMLPLIGIASPLGMASILGLLLGVIALLRENRFVGFVAIVISSVSLFLNPAAWALLVSLWTGVYCKVTTCTPSAAQTVQAPVPNVQTPPIPQVTHSPLSANALVQYPDGWTTKKFDETPDAIATHFYAKSNDLMQEYAASPNYAATFMYGVWNKAEQETIDNFIRKNIEETVHSKNPNLQVTPMDPVIISNHGDPALNTAHLRILGDGTGHEEAIAFIDGGSYVFTLVMAAPNRDELMKAWPVFSDTLINRVTFVVMKGQQVPVVPAAPAAPPAPPPAPAQ